jgi:hypothetical protein
MYTFVKQDTKYSDADKGCHTQGNTIEDAIEKDPIKARLEVLDKDLVT